MNDPRPLAARPTDGQRDALRATLLAAARFPVYREHFAAAGLSDAAIRADPLGSLTRLPLFRSELLAALAREALERRPYDLGGVELSSGTGGVPKRRILSEEDVALDAAQVTRLLQVAGVQAQDHVAAIELTVTPLAAAFLEGCERLGVREATAFAWRPGADATPLRRLAPSVLLAPPSLLERLDTFWPGLRLVIFNGDRLGPEAGAQLRGVGAGLRSLYGLTETSALGVGCAEEDGVHLAPEHGFFELGALSPVASAPRPTSGAPCRPRSEPGPAAELLPLEREYELIVTTLGFSMPLLRYPTGDRVRPLPGRCPCGLTWPRVEILGRLGTRFALFEIETSVDELQALLFQSDADTPLQVRLADAPDGRVRMTLRMPRFLLPQRRLLRARLSTHPLIDHLLATRLLEVRFEAWQPAAGRKSALLVDRRRRSQGRAGETSEQ